MASYVNLADIAVGNTITVQEANNRAAYIVLRHGYTTIGGIPQTLIVRKNVIHDTGQWASFGRNSYENSSLDSRMSSFFNSLPGWVKDYIPSISLQIRDIGSGSNRTISRRAFALSRAELFDVGGDGEHIAYFNSNSRRMASADGGGFQSWWTRSPVNSGVFSLAYYVDGGTGAENDRTQISLADLRPAFCFPANLTIETSNNNYALPNVSPMVSGIVAVSKNPIKQWEGTFSILWTAATDQDTPVNSLTYIAQKSYDNGATWIDAAMVQGATSATQVLGYNETTQVRYRVTARDGYCQSLYWLDSGNIQVLNNIPPTTPGDINVGPLPLVQSGAATISWSASTDANNNLSGYRLYNRVNGGAWGTTPIYDSGERSYTDALGDNWITVQYRVCAYDSYSETSGFRESATFTIKPLVEIAVEQHTNSGIKNGSTYTADTARTLMFAVSNTVDPVMSARYTVVLKFDGALIEQKTMAIPSGVYTYELTKFQWQCILNGQHIYTLTVTDTEGNSGQGSITFTKNITQIVVKSNPFEVQINSGIVKNALMNILGAFPPGSVLLVEFTNNAKDDISVWQEILPGQLDGSYFPVNNTVIDNGNWCQVRVTLNRGTATAACWIAQISGMAGLSQTFILSEDNKQLRQDLDDLADQVEVNRLAAFTYKGSVADFASLPASPGINDVWETLDTGDEWYWNGASWKPFGPTVVTDTVPTENSTNPITSGAVYDATQTLQAQIDELKTVLGSLAEALNPQ